MEKLIEEFPRNCLIDVKNPKSIKGALVDFMIHVVGKDPKFATERDWYYALAYMVRGMLSERYIDTGRQQYNQDVKRMYYLSMEYLIGRSLVKQLLDLGFHDKVEKALAEYGVNLEDVAEHEPDAALGNGGLGRLAACFVDSIATHEYPGFGYGIRYEFGMFTQRIAHGQQVEQPENWLRYGNPWEFERPDVTWRVKYYGRLEDGQNERGQAVRRWVDTNDVMAIAYDVPVSGYGADTVTNLRLWSASAAEDFDLQSFNEGNYVDAVRDKTLSENLSKVLYPNDATMWGQELRLKQEYFFVSASIQDIIERYMRTHDTLDGLPEKVAIQLNDTHPALGPAELMRILMDEYGYDFGKAWEITKGTFAYTNHTLLPEALEVWGIDMLERVLPRHLEIIYQINHVFLEQVRGDFPGDDNMIAKVSLVNDGGGSIRMAHLAVVSSQKVNGVAALHTELLRTNMFPEFDRIYPGKFVNMTNGITARRWLLQSNPLLSKLITDSIGDKWITDLDDLKKLVPLADDKKFQKKFADIKRKNKERLAKFINRRLDMDVNVDSMFDGQVKRIHEYKRQLLNILHVITRYNRIKDNPGQDIVPRTVIIGGKAAPGYYLAKQIIYLINEVARVVNNDPDVGDKLKLLFIPNFNVSSGEIVYPGCELSEQISTSGTEASGTGNMKFSLNGALTIGTLDGANVEIREEVGAENFFLFGLTAQEVDNMRNQGYDPWGYYNSDHELRRSLDMIRDGYFSSGDRGRFDMIMQTLLDNGDYFMLLADYRSYIECQEQVDENYRDQTDWTRKSILNVANMGKFSSDRTIHSYCGDIWNIQKAK